MNTTNTLRSAARALGPALLVASTLLAGSASAGTLQVRDEEHLFSAEDRTALQQDAAAYPFDVRVLTTSAHASDFDHYVGEQVGPPNMVVVGLDKEHRHVSVHFGVGSHIAPTEFHAIEQAGTASFKEGAFRAGVESILNRAKAAVGTSPAVGERSAAPAPAHTQSSGFPFGWVVLGGLVLVGFLALRRAFANGMGNQYPPNLPPGGNYGPGYGSGYGPGYGGGGSGIGSGILGAGLGGLAGYELGKAMGEREEREREGGMFGGGTSSDDRDRGGNSDAGGDTGSWDDGNSGGDWGGDDSGGNDAGGSDGGW